MKPEVQSALLEAAAKSGVRGPDVDRLATLHAGSPEASELANRLRRSIEHAHLQTKRSGLRPACLVVHAVSFDAEPTVSVNGGAGHRVDMCISVAQGSHRVRLDTAEPHEPLEHSVRVTAGTTVVPVTFTRTR